MKRSLAAIPVAALLACTPDDGVATQADGGTAPPCLGARLLFNQPGTLEPWLLRDGANVLVTPGIPVEVLAVNASGTAFEQVEYVVLPVDHGHRVEALGTGGNQGARLTPGDHEEVLTLRALVGADNVTGCVLQEFVQVRRADFCTGEDVTLRAGAPGQPPAESGGNLRISIETVVAMSVTPGPRRVGGQAVLLGDTPAGGPWARVAEGSITYSAGTQPVVEHLLALVTSAAERPCTLPIELEVVDTPDVCAIVAPHVGSELFGAATLRLSAQQSVVFETSAFPGQVTTYELLAGGVGALVPGGTGATFTAPATPGTAVIRARVDAPTYRICTINQRVEVGAVSPASSSSSGPPPSSSAPASSAAPSSLASSSSALPSSSSSGGECYPEVVFSQVHTVGGKPGAGYRQDFIELHNRTRAAFSLDGWFIQMRPVGTFDWTVMPLAGTMAAGGYFLVRLGSSGAVAGNTATPDQEFASINLPDTDFALMLLFAEHTGLMCPTTTREVASFVAASGNLVCTVGSAAVGTPAGAQSFTRNNDDVGCLHAYDSALNWRVAQVRSARNSQDPVSLCSCL